jgi:acyl-CoA dehydrogenase
VRTDRSFLSWPFFDESHRALAEQVERICHDESKAWTGSAFDEDDQAAVDNTCRAIVRRLGERGVLRHATPAGNGSSARLDVRSLCIVRETLARYAPLADFAFAMQGLGCGPISLFGSAEQRERYLSRVAEGKAIAAFALSEPGAGSDVAAMQTTARQDGKDFVCSDAGRR